ncbi:hypothetical protein DPMN_005832 [Dreissena polymorpha]|uniref:Uncharacterized protein n=1 Tax=Dreissena polymorpha TaxID=45954 RepID=A0A9D4MTG9_DREPO|nr:hypothetical protein DPMN_005832 [Dreissena polymorpha]
MLAFNPFGLAAGSGSVSGSGCTGPFCTMTGSSGTASSGNLDARNRIGQDPNLMLLFSILQLTH